MIHNREGSNFLEDAREFIDVAIDNVGTSVPPRLQSIGFNKVRPIVRGRSELPPIVHSVLDITKRM